MVHSNVTIIFHSYICNSNICQIKLDFQVRTLQTIGPDLARPGRQVQREGGEGRRHRKG